MVDTATTKAVPAAAAHATRQVTGAACCAAYCATPAGGCGRGDPPAAGPGAVRSVAYRQRSYQTSMFLRLKPIGSDGFRWARMSWDATCCRG